MMVSDSFIRAGLSVFIALTVSVSGYFLIDLNLPDYAEVFDPRVIDYYKMFDSRPQNFWYKVFLAVLFLSALALGFARMPGLRSADTPKDRSMTDTSRRRWCAGLAVKADKATPILVLSIFALIAFHYFQGEQRRIVSVGIQIFFFLAAFLVVAAPHIRTGTLVLVSCAVLLLGLAPLLDPRSIGYGSIEILSVSDWHYTAVLGTAYTLESGLRWFDQSVPIYGMAMPLFVAALHDFGLDASMTVLKQIVIFVQIAALSAFLVLVHRNAAALARGMTFDRSRFVWVSVLIALLLTGAYLAPFSFSHVVPNQSLMRFLPLVLLIGVLGLMGRHLSGKASFLSGAFLCFAFFYSAEMGIVCGAGMFCAALVWFRQSQGARSYIRQALFACAGFAVTGLLLFVLYLSLVGQIGGGLSSYLTAISVNASGFAGLPLDDDLRFVFILIHCSLIASAGLIFVIRGQGAVTVVETGLAVCILVWLAYYVNRPDAMNLWSIILMYGVLLLPWISRNWRNPWAMTVLMLVFVIHPARSMSSAYENFLLIAQDSPEFVECEGLVRVSPEDCTQFQQRFGELLALRAETPESIWMTHFPLLTYFRLGEIPATNLIDQFAPNQMLPRQQAFVSEIRALDPDAIFVDTFGQDLRMDMFVGFATSAGYQDCNANLTFWHVYRKTC